MQLCCSRLKWLPSALAKQNPNSFPCPAGTCVTPLVPTSPALIAQPALLPWSLHSNLIDPLAPQSCYNSFCYTVFARAAPALWNDSLSFFSLVNPPPSLPILSWSQLLRKAFPNEAESPSYVLSGTIKHSFLIAYALPFITVRLVWLNLSLSSDSNFFEGWTGSGFFTIICPACNTESAMNVYIRYVFEWIN